METKLSSTRKCLSAAMAAAILLASPGLSGYQAAAQVVSARAGGAAPVSLAAPPTGLGASPEFSISATLSPQTLEAALPAPDVAAPAVSYSATTGLQPSFAAALPFISAIQAPSEIGRTPAQDVNRAAAQALNDSEGAGSRAEPAAQSLPPARSEAAALAAPQEEGRAGASPEARFTRIFDGSAPRTASPDLDAVPEAGQVGESAPSGLSAPGTGPSLRTRARVDAAALAGIPKDAVDDSDLVIRLLRQAREGASRPVPQAAKNFRFLIIPGLGWKLAGESYARTNLEFFRAHGIEAELVQTDPLGTKEVNAEIVKAAIESSGKPVILWGHSKGGVDAAAALETYPELQQRVAKFITTQTPYFGTPWADWVMRRPWVFDLLAISSKLTHPGRLKGVTPWGRRETPRQLTRAERGSLPREGSPFRPGLEVYSIASQVKRWGLTGLAEWFKIHVFKALPKRGSDGVIVAGDSILPGSRYAILDEVSHSDPFTSSKHFDTSLLVNQNFQHGDFAADLTESVLHWIFAKEAPAAAAKAAPAPLQDAEKENLDFLFRAGFRSPDEGVDPAAPGLVEMQRQVLERGASKRDYFAASRTLAAKIMAGVAEQGYSPLALDKAASLAADLLAMKSSPAPAEMPLAAAATPGKALRWMVGATREAMGRQLERLAAQAADAMFSPADLERLKAGDAAMVRRTGELKALLGDILLTLYTDPDIGHTRFAGRALAAVLVRHARMRGVPELERALEDKLAARGMKLGDHLGTRFEVGDRYGNTHRFEVRSGDNLGRRPRDRSAAEIAAGARPHWTNWWRAWMDKVLGPIVAIWIDPAEERPTQVPGQPLRNFLRRLIHSFRRWLGSREMFLRGYSHTGVVEVSEADGVAVPWVYHVSVDSWEGRVYKSAVMHDFVQPGSHTRVGLSRMSPERAAAEYLRQAANPALGTHPYFASDVWPFGASQAEKDNLRALAETDPAAFLRELHRGAVGAIEKLMALGIGYAYGFMDQELRAQCSSIMVLIYLLGAGFNRQPKPDMWNPLVYVFKALGIANTDGLRTDMSIIWPASFFVDDLTAVHQYAELAVEPAQAPSSAFNAGLPDRASPWAEALGPAGLSEEAVLRALSAQMIARQRKRAGAIGWKTGLNDPPPSSFFAQLESLWIRSQAGRERP